MQLLLVPVFQSKKALDILMSLLFHTSFFACKHAQNILKLLFYLFGDNGE